MASRRLRLRVGVTLLVALGVAGCSKDGPTQPIASDVDLVAVSGNGQFGPAGQPLIDPLVVSVLRTVDGRPAEDVTVEWTISDGSGAVLSPATTHSDSTGLATVQFRLGAALGRYRVEARLRDRPERFVEFEAWAVLPPQLTTMSTASAEAGHTITLDGDNFSTVASHNVVLFSGIRGDVVTAGPTRLSVVVPTCLPSRTVSVSVRLGGQASGVLPLAVQATGGALDLDFGADTALVIGSGPSCVRLVAGNWLAVAQSVSSIGAARFDYRLTGLRQESGGLAARQVYPPGSFVGPNPVHPTASGAIPTAREEWKLFLRALEKRLVGKRRGSANRLSLSPREQAPDVGERRDFQVVRADGGFDRVTAEVRVISERAILYVDVEALANLPMEDTERFGDLFDDPIYSVDVSAFGATSDVDDNGKVIILFTPSVNRLTAPGSGDFVGGFFFGLDLFTEAENSNAAEVFYVMVPDPAGEYGNVQSLDLIRTTVPAILAHELQHMIHHNERIIERNDERADALWLSEALAQMGEDLVGEELRRRGSGEAKTYQVGNWRRANRFLADPEDVSLIVATGQGTLAERGAGWMFVRYLRDQAGSDAVLASLTQTTRTGIDNVEAVTGASWEDLFSDWSAAIAVERQLAESSQLPVRPALQFPGVDLVETFSDGVGSYALTPTLITVGDFYADGRLWSSSGAHFLLGSGEGGLAVSLAGAEGGVAPPQAGLRLKLVRLF